MIQHSDIEFLHAFSSHGVYIVELRRLDKDGSASPDEVYFWLRMKANDIERLILLATETDDGIAVREFTDGVLSFDDQVGEYLYSNGESLALDRIGKGSIERAVKSKFLDYLQIHTD